MFYFLRGKLAVLQPGFAVLDAGGVGFRLTISATTHQALSAADKSVPVQLLTHLSVREDDMELFGFATEAELDAFKLLITVSGVGPKAALSVLSCLTPEKFALAVCTDDKKAIARASGVGPKTAARIILELHDKIAADSAFASSDDSPSSSVAGTPTGGKLAEAQEALLVLGYNRAQVLGVLRDIDTAAMELEDIIRTALKKLVR